MEAQYILAGIDVHKKMLAVVVANAGAPELQFECRRFGTTVSELRHLAAWLQEHAVREVVMESAQYWRPVWLALEGQCRLHLAQARSNRGPRGRKTDFRDAQRAVSRLLSGDLVLSYVPDAEQRCWRTLTRTKYQLTRDKVRLQSQLESLLEECQVKLSSVVSDLLGASGQRILRAMAQRETDPARLAQLDHRQRHFRRPPSWPRGLEFVLDSRTVPEYLAATARPRQPFHASASQSARPRCGPEGRLPASDRFPPLIRPFGLRQSSLGYCPPPLSPNWKVLHEGVSYVEFGPVPTPITLKRRRQRLVTQLKNLGYDVQLTPRISDASTA